MFDELTLEKNDLDIKEPKRNYKDNRLYYYR